MDLCLYRDRDGHYVDNRERPLPTAPTLDCTGVVAVAWAAALLFVIDLIVLCLAELASNTTVGTDLPVPGAVAAGAFLPVGVVLLYVRLVVRDRGSRRRLAHPTSVDLSAPDSEDLRKLWFGTRDAVGALWDEALARPGDALRAELDTARRARDRLAVVLGQVAEARVRRRDLRVLVGALPPGDPTRPAFEGNMSQWDCAAAESVEEATRLAGTVRRLSAAAVSFGEAMRARDALALAGSPGAPAGGGRSEEERDAEEMTAGLQAARAALDV